MDSDIKALYIVCNAGYADDIMDIVRGAGARGGTIVNARGTGAQFQSFMGITCEYEREIIISVVDKATADKIMTDVKAKVGGNPEIRGICFTSPVEHVIGISQAQ